MPSRRFFPSLWMVLLLVAAILVPTTLAASRGDKTFSTQNAYNDRRAPKPVSSLNVEAADSASVTLDWSRTWDNVGVEGYGVYLDGARKGQTASTDYTFDQLVCGKGYTLGVDAFDDAGNRSRTTSTFASTAACGDVTAPSAPSNVRTVASTETQVILAWSPSTDDFGVVGYGLYVGGFWVGQWSEPSATITNLSCGQTYQIAIDASDAAGNESARTNAFFSTAPCSDHTPPSTPTSLVVSKSSTTGVTLSWAASTDASGIAEYGLYRNGSKVGTTTGTTGDFAGLQCGTTYTLGVDASDKAQNRSAVASLTGATAPCATTTPPPPSTSVPTTPPNLHTTSVTQTAVALAWDSSTATNGMSGYQVFRDGAKIGEGPGVHGGYTNSWNDSGRTCGTSYQYAVAGVDSNGNVGAKSTLTVSTSACDAPPPPVESTPPPPTGTTPPPPTGTTQTGLSAPPNLRTSSVTQTSVALAWDASKTADGTAGYRVFRDGTKLGEGPGVYGGYTNSWNDAGRTCGTKYVYSVVGIDASGNAGPASTLSVTTAACDATTPPPPTSSPPPPSTDTTAPTKPATVTASTRTATSIALTWQPSTDNVSVTGYGLYRGGSRVATVTTTTWIFSGLTCNTSYTLAVDAVDAAGNRSEQAVVMVSTTACADTQAPTPPTGLRASNVTGTGATLSWSASTDNVGVTGYDVLSNGSKVASVTTPSSTLSGLSCGTSYTFAVVASDAAGNRSPQTQLVTSTAACPPQTQTTGGTLTSAQCSSRAAVGGSVIDGATVTGDCNITAANVTIQNSTVNGVIEVRASGFKLLNSHVDQFTLASRGDNALLDGNVFDGKNVHEQNFIWADDIVGDGPTGWVIRNNTFQNYTSPGSTHSEAIFIGGYAANGLIEGNTFYRNGNTGHIFFSWCAPNDCNGTGGTPRDPHDICVRGNTFKETWEAYFQVMIRQETFAPNGHGIYTDDNIRIAPGQSVSSKATDSNILVQFLAGDNLQFQIPC